MSREKLRVYISGPITGTTDHMERFAAAEKKLTEAGVEVLNPARMGAELPESFTHAEHLEVDIAALHKCDAIYLMDGWQDSQGARREFIEAKQAGILVFSKDEITELSRIAGTFADRAATAMGDVPEVCGTCIHHKYENTCDDWVCMCEQGEFFANWTGYEDKCECWEARQ